MEEYLVIATIVAVVFGLLQIILFFKLWIMTNDVRKLRRKFVDNEVQQEIEPVAAKDGKTLKIVSSIGVALSLVGGMFVPLWLLGCIIIADIVLLVFAFIKR